MNASMLIMQSVAQTSLIQTLEFHNFSESLNLKVKIKIPVSLDLALFRIWDDILS